METLKVIPHKGNRLTEEHKLNIRRLYLEYASIAKVSERTGWSKRVVNKVVKMESEKVPNSRDFPGEVLQKDINGNIINRFSSARKAESVTGISQSTICHCICGKTETAGGFRWERVNRRNDGD